MPCWGQNRSLTNGPAFDQPLQRIQNNMKVEVQYMWQENFKIIWYLTTNILSRGGKDMRHADSICWIEICLLSRSLSRFAFSLTVELVKSITPLLHWCTVFASNGSAAPSFRYRFLSFKKGTSTLLCLCNFLSVSPSPFLLFHLCTPSAFFPSSSSLLTFLFFVVWPVWEFFV